MAHGKTGQRASDAYRVDEQEIDSATTPQYPAHMLPSPTRKIGAKVRV